MMSVFDKHKKGFAPSLTSIEIEGANMRAARERISSAFAELSVASAFDEYRKALRAGHLEVADLDGDWIYPLAHYAAQERQPDDALRLLNGFSSHYAQHDDVVKNYVLAAEIMHRDFAQTEDALQLLQRLATQYVGHKDYALISALQAQLEEK